MNETQIRELLKTAGHGIASEPIDADSLLAASRRSARKRRLVQVLSASTAVAVIVALALVLVPRGGDPQKPSTEPATDEQLAPPGMRLVGMNGVAVAVPEDWGTDQTRCNVAVENTVVFDKGTYRSCRISPPPDSSSVHLAAASSLPGEYWKAQVDHFEEVDGMRVGIAPVRPVSCNAEIKLACTGGPAGAVVIAANDVAIWAQSRDGSLVRDLLASVQGIPDGYTAVPEVAGLPEAKARETLEQAGLRAPDEVVCRQADGGPWVEMCSDVTGSDLPRGSVVSAGSEVELLSSPSQFAPSARLLSQRRLEISVYGSSSCPELADSVDSAANNGATVHVSQHGGPTCTADLRPSRSVVTLPAEIDTGQAISLTLVRSDVPAARWNAVVPPFVRISVPSVVGLPIVEAREALRMAGLRVTTRLVFRANKPVRRITGQIPEAGTRVLAGSAVTILNGAPTFPEPAPDGQPPTNRGAAADCPTVMPELTGYYDERHPPVDRDLKAPLPVCKYSGQRIDLDPAKPAIAGDVWGDYRLAGGAVIEGDDLRHVARLVKTAPAHPEEGMYVEGPDPRTPVFLRLPTTDGRYTWVWMESAVSAYSFRGRLRAVPDELIATVKAVV